MSSCWHIDKLANYCNKIGSGSTPRGGKGEYLDYGISLIRSQNVYNTGFSDDGLAFIDDTQADELRNVEVQSQDVLLNITGESVGRCCQVPDRILPARVNQHVVIIRTNKDRLDPGFLRYYLITPLAQGKLEGLSSSGATRRALTKGMIESLEIPIPPIGEQRKIAAILGSLDDKIELNRRMNATLESMAQAIFQSWFIDFDPSKIGSGQMPACRATHDPKVLGPFPSTIKDAELRPATTEDDPFDAFESPTVQMLMDAKVLNMGDGYRAKRVELSDEGLPFVRAGNLHDGGFQFENAEILGFDGVDKAGEKKSEAFDVAFTSKGTVGRMTLVTAQTQQFVYSPQVCWWRVVDSNRLNPHVLYRWMKSDEFIRQVLLVKSQTDMAEYVSLRDQRAMRVNLPSAKFQNLIAPQLEQIDATLASNIAERQQLENLRDTLLPRLLSGNPNTLQTIDCDI